MTVCGVYAGYVNSWTDSQGITWNLAASDDPYPPTHEYIPETGTPDPVSFWITGASFPVARLQAADGVVQIPSMAVWYSHGDGSTPQAQPHPDLNVAISSMNADTFRDNSLVRKVLCPYNVQVKTPCFLRCPKLESINCPADGASPLSKNATSDGVLYDGTMTRLLKYPEGKSGSIYTVPASVKKLENYSLANTQLKRIRFQGGVPEMDSNMTAFGSQVNQIYYPFGSQEWLSVLEYAKTESDVVYSMSPDSYASPSVGECLCFCGCRATAWLDAPQVEVEETYDGVTLSWDPVPNATLYRVVYRSDSTNLLCKSEGMGVLRRGFKMVYFGVEKGQMVPGERYHFWVQAVYSSKSSWVGADIRARKKPSDERGYFDGLYCWWEGESDPNLGYAVGARKIGRLKPQIEGDVLVGYEYGKPDNNEDVGILRDGVLTIPEGVKKISGTIEEPDGDPDYGIWKMINKVVLPSSVKEIDISSWLPYVPKVVGGENVEYCEASCDLPDNGQGFEIVYVGKCAVGRRGRNAIDKQYEAEKDKDLWAFELSLREGTTSVTGLNNLYATSVALPDSVRVVCTRAFWGDSDLRSVKLGTGVEAVEEEAFDISVGSGGRGSGGPGTLTLPPGLKSIGRRAFAGWKNLTEIVIPESVTNIGDMAFNDSVSLTSIVIENPDLVMRCHAFPESVWQYFRLPQKEGYVMDGWWIWGSDRSTGIKCATFEEVKRCSSAYYYGNVAINWKLDDGEAPLTVKHRVSFYESPERWISQGTAVEVREVEEGTKIGALPSVSMAGYAFDGWWVIDEGFEKWDDIYQSRIDADTIMADDRVVCGKWIANTYFLNFNANGGNVSPERMGVTYDGAVPDLPTPVRDGFLFRGWYATGDRRFPSEVLDEDGEGGYCYTLAEDLTLSAAWEKEPLKEPLEEDKPPEEPVEPTTPTNAPPKVVDEAETHVDIEKGEVAPIETAAAVYDGFLYEGETVIGSVQVKVAKMKNGEAKVTATVQMAGQSKKLSFKGGVADAAGAVTDMTDKDGNNLAVTVGVNGLGGEFRRSRSDTPYRIDGARNVFSGKSDADKSAAEKAMQAHMATYNVAFDGGTLSVAVGKKGKVKIAGTVNGSKVSATSQLVVGDSAAVVPVVIVKKAEVSFCLWLNAKGGVEVRGVNFVTSGEDSASPFWEAGKSGTIADGAKFWMDEAAVGKMKGWLTGLYADYLPKGVAVDQNGKKWIVAEGAKAGKVAFAKGATTIDTSKLGENPSGLKLSYKEKDGTFKGSFKAYNLEGGKIKSYTVSVTGVMIGNTGYGTVTIKKLGTVAVKVSKDAPVGGTPGM